MSETRDFEIVPPVDKSNAPHNWVERWRVKLPPGSRRRRLYDRLALPVDAPSEFVEDEKDLVAGMLPKTGDLVADAQRADEILREAEQIFQRAEDRASGAMTRATTLQGAVAIAGSLLIAGAGLILDQSKLYGAGWRIAFATVLLGATVALVMTGLRALSATSTIHRWHRPTATDIMRRSQLAPTEARVQLAVETLADYGYNTKIAAWKVAYLGAAAWWFRLALGLLVVLVTLVCAYAVAAPHESETASAPMRPNTASQGGAAARVGRAGNPRLGNKNESDKPGARGMRW